MRQGFIAFPSRKYREIERGIRVCFISTDREEMTSPDVFENAAVITFVLALLITNRKNVCKKKHVSIIIIVKFDMRIASIVRISHVSIPVAETARKKLS